MLKAKDVKVVILGDAGLISLLSPNNPP